MSVENHNVTHKYLFEISQQSHYHMNQFDVHKDVGAIISKIS